MCPHLGHFGFCPCAVHWGPPRRQGLGSQCALISAISDFVTVQSIGDPGDGRGWIAVAPACGPFLIFSLCKAFVTPQTEGVSEPLCPHVGQF